jgi:hypothetical protein
VLQAPDAPRSNPPHVQGSDMNFPNSPPRPFSTLTDFDIIEVSELPTDNRPTMPPGLIGAMRLDRERRIARYNKASR